MSGDAVRNVTILMNIKAGTIEAPDLSPWAAARTAVADVNAGMKSLAETQRELAASEQTLGQAAKETVQIEDQKAKMHKTVETSAKQSADVQVEQSNRVVETVAKNMKTIEEMTARRPLREPGESASAPAGTPEEITGRRPLREPGESGPSSQQTIVTPQMDGRKAAMDGLADYSANIEAEMDANMRKYEKEQLARQQKELEERQRMMQREAAEQQRAEEQMAAAIIQTRAALNKQRVREHEEEQAIVRRETELSIAESQKQLEQEQAAFEEAEQQRRKELAAVEAMTQKEIAENEKGLQREAEDQQRAQEQMAADIIRTRAALNKQRVREHEDEQAMIQRETELSVAEAQKQIEQEQAAFDEAEQMRADELAAVEAATQKEIADNEKALAQQSAAEMKFREDMRNQRIKEEEQTAAQAEKAQAELEKSQKKQAAAELKFRQDMRDQRIEEEEAEAEAAREQAESILEFRARMNQQRLREEERTTQAVLQAQNRLPVLLRGVQQDMSQVIGSTAQFISHLSMLDSIGGESLENIAKKFAEIQSTVGLISSSQSIFSNVGEGLGKLQQMGAATQTIVNSQQALGVATTFSQAATLRLAGAAGTLQVAMGPISLIMTGIMAAIVVAEIAMDAFGESSEDTAEKQRVQEAVIRGFNEQLQESIRLLEQEKSLLDSQTAIMNTQWDIKRALAGEEKVSAGDMKKHIEDQSQAQTSALDKAMDISVAKMKETVSDPDIDEAKRLAAEEEKKAKEMSSLQSYRAERARTGYDTEHADSLISDKQKEIDRNFLEQEDLLNKTKTTGTLQDLIATPEKMDKLGQTQIKDGMITDFGLMEQRLKEIPNELALTFLQDIQKPMQEQAKETQQSLGESQRALSDAEANKKKAEQGIIAEEKRFNAEEDMATKFGLAEGGFAKDEAMAALDRFDAAKTPEEKAMAADEAERTLREQGLLSAEADDMLRGSNTDTTAVRNQIKDDSEISQEEKTQNDQTVASLTDMKMEADAAILAMPRLIEELKAKLKAINDQQTQLSNAMRVRDGI